MGRFRACLHMLTSLLLLSFPLTANQAVALTDAGLSISQAATVSQYERILFGEVRSKRALATRIKDLEINLFGREHKGGLDARLGAIGKMLGKQKPSYLLPPMAPTLGTLQSNPPTLLSSGTQPGPNQSYSNKLEERFGAPSFGTERQTDHKTNLLRQAVERYSAGDTNEAERLFKSVLALDPTNGDAHFNLGAIAESKGNLDLALSHYQSAQKATPLDSEVKDAVQSVVRQIQLRQEAIADTQRLKNAQAQVERHRLELQQLANRAANAYRNQNYDEAISYLNRLAKEAPDDAQVQYALAQAYRGKGDLNQGRAHINEAVSIDPGNQLYRKTLGDMEREAQNQTLASSDNDNTPAGKITPFVQDEAGVSNHENSYASYGRSFSGLLSNLLPGAQWGQSYGYAPEITYRSGGPGSTRLKRAALGGLTGAAVGALMGKGSEGGVKRGAISGAVIGGLAGFFLGGN